MSEAEPVGSSIKERIEPVRGDTALDRGGCLPGVEILCGLPKRLNGAIGWGRTFEGRGEWTERQACLMAVYLEGNLKMIY